MGKERVAVIDPGPDMDEHVRALSSALSGASEVLILLTHHHKDHTEAVSSLAHLTGARVLGPSSTGGEVLRHQASVRTDEGSLRALHTPGHTRDHLAFHWEEAGALFCGDLILGRGDTTWLGEYPGCVADYLGSLMEVELLAPRVLYPAHGPPIRHPPEAVARFRRHRMHRLKELREVRQAFPAAGVDELAQAVYGRALPQRLLKAVRLSVEVMLHHLDQEASFPG